MEQKIYDLNEYSLEVKDGKAVLKRKRKLKWRECKAGDFICFGDNCIGIYNQKSNNVGKFWTRCFLDKDKFTYYCSEHSYTNVRLASEEEKKRLLAAIDKGGFIWDSENLTMKKKFEFDDGVFVADAGGDLFIHWKTGDSDFSHGSYVYWNRESDDIVLDREYNMTTAVRFATEEEIIALAARLAKKGLEWDSKNKRLREKRWRAEMGEVYYAVCVSQAICVVDYIEGGVSFDDRCFEICNYFRTKEQAEKVAEEIRKIFEKYKEE